MGTDEPRRFLVAVGVGNYKDARWERLNQVPREIDLIVSLLTAGRFGVQRVLESASTLPRRESLLAAFRDWTNTTARRRADHLIVYWTGHGEIYAGEMYFVLPGTTSVEVDGLKLSDVVNVLLGPSSNSGPVLLFLDVCFAGHGMLDIGESSRCWRANGRRDCRANLRSRRDARSRRSEPSRFRRGLQERRRSSSRRIDPSER